MNGEWDRDLIQRKQPWWETVPAFPGISEALERREQKGQFPFIQPGWGKFQQALQPVKEWARKKPALAWLELLEGVSPPAPTEYAGIPTPLKIPQDIWRNYFAEYKVSKEAQERLKELELAPLRYAGYPSKTSYYAQQSRDIGAERSIATIAHEVAHDIWFHEFTENQKQEFTRLMELPENKWLTWQLSHTWYRERGLPSPPEEQHAMLYQVYPYFSKVIPEYFDKFYLFLDVGQFRKITESSFPTPLPKREIRMKIPERFE